MILARPFYFKLVVGNEAYRGKLVCQINKPAEWDGERENTNTYPCVCCPNHRKKRHFLKRPSPTDCTSRITTPTGQQVHPWNYSWSLLWASMSANLCPILLFQLGFIPPFTSSSSQPPPSLPVSGHSHLSSALQLVAHKYPPSIAHSRLYTPR